MVGLFSAKTSFSAVWKVERGWDVRGGGVDCGTVACGISQRQSACVHILAHSHCWIFALYALLLYVKL